MSADTARCRITEDDDSRAGVLSLRMGARSWRLLGLVFAGCAALALWGPTPQLRGAEQGFDLAALEAALTRHVGPAQ